MTPSSPLSPVVADLVMRNLERTLYLIQSPLPFYYRYVNDIIMTVPTTLIDSVLGIFNSQYPRTQFIMKVCNNG